MKKTTILLLIFTCFGSIPHVISQFSIQYSGVNKDLLCVHFVDENTGYAGGEQGQLIKTQSGGVAWNILKTGNKQTINGLFFLNADTGFIVGESNTFIKTNDGGLSWSLVENVPNADYTAIKFVDNKFGFAIGHNLDGGVFCRTDDSGETWITRTISQDCSSSGLTPGIDCDDIYLTNFSFLDDNTGLIGGFTYNFSFGKHPFVCKTTDGGRTFTDISPKEGERDWYNGKEIVSINYMNNNDACAVMNTGNGTDFMFISDYNVKTFEQNQLVSNFSSRGRFFTSEFLGRFIGYFAGIIEGNSQIIKTIDQGNSFLYLNPPTDKTIYASCFVDVNNGYFVGQDGTILHLQDKANIVYNSMDIRGEKYIDPPFTLASTKRNKKIMQVHVYNVPHENPEMFDISVFDSQGEPVAVKPRSIKVYSDEIRMKVKTDGLGDRTYFYTVLYDNNTVVNGKLMLNGFAQNFE